MALYVQKFGGTSVGNVQCINRVIQIIQKTRQAGHDVVVVVSAMGHETDRLVTLMQSLTANPNLREYDALLATGEQVSAAMVSAALNGIGCSARSYNGSQARIYTDQRYSKAQIVKIDTAPILEDLRKGIVPVVTGFQGIDHEGNITTIGRGGSDTTAVMLAAALKADECQIYTDVEGIYTSDPRIVHDARRLSKITFDEMLELARLGAEVLQTSSVRLAERHRVPLRVLSSFVEGNGTLVTFLEAEVLEPMVSGIAFDRNQAKLTFRGLQCSDSIWIDQWLEALQNAVIEVDMMVKTPPLDQDYIDFSVTVPLNDYHQAISISNEMIQQLQSPCQILVDDRIAKLSLVGVGMKTHAGVAAKMLHALGEEGIKIHLITSSEVTVSAVVDEKYMELGARILHTAFLGEQNSLKN
ncbi:MAG: aspartate kinase [Proteobacteria bacterium]|nr:aspartate kinase [Pseudomonadota bacterium]